MADIADRLSGAVTGDKTRAWPSFFSQVNRLPQCQSGLLVYIAVWCMNRLPDPIHRLSAQIRLVRCMEVGNDDWIAENLSPYQLLPESQMTGFLVAGEAQGPRWLIWALCEVNENRSASANRVFVLIGHTTVIDRFE